MIELTVEFDDEYSEKLEKYCRETDQKLIQAVERIVVAHLDRYEKDHNCSTCEFNFGNVCAGYGKRTDNGESTYGMPMDEAEKMFPNGCEDWGISFGAFSEENYDPRDPDGIRFFWQLKHITVFMERRHF